MKRVERDKGMYKLSCAKGKGLIEGGGEKERERDRERGGGVEGRTGAGEINLSSDGNETMRTRLYGILSSHELSVT